MLMTKVCVNIFQIKQVMAKNILVLIHGDIQRPNDKSWNLELRTCITGHNERGLIEYFAVAMPL